MYGLAVIQERLDKNPTLAYEYQGRWHSYSNNKLIKFEPENFSPVKNLEWYDGAPTSYERWHFIVQTEEGNIILSTYEGDSWFSLHTGRRLLVNVIRWARVTWIDL